MIIKKGSTTPAWLYIVFLFSIAALLFSIKIPNGFYLGDMVLGVFNMSMNKYAVAAVFFLSYYIALKNKQKVKKETFQMYMVTVSTLIAISIISYIF